MDRDIVFVALFASLIAALGVLPPLTLMSGVPISAQSLGVMLCGTVLGARRGALAVALFLVMVAIGLPVLSGGRGGLGVFASPTAGFLIGFLPGAFAVGLIRQALGRLNLMLAASIASVVGGIGVLYVFGVAGLMIALDSRLIDAALLSLPFLPGDLVKAVIAGWLTELLWRARPGVVLSR